MEEARVKRVQVALLGLVTLLVATAGPAAAITYGEPDAGEHPYVGFMIYFDPNEPGWFSCSGTLMDADTFLTAGHCTYGVGTKGKVSARPTGGTDVWVTFQEKDTLLGWPARTPGIDEDVLYRQRSEWLNANRAYTRGTAIPHPRYDNFSGFPANFDVGVVQLDRASKVTSRGVLAPIGTVDGLAAEASHRNDAVIETVGYGIQSIQPHPMDTEARYKSTSRIVEVESSIARGGNLHTLNNPSEVGGVGGSCFGDSGGPLFVNDTNQVVAVVSFGFSLTCHGADYSWRVDTREAQRFVGQYLGG
jgi:hypothetical protein